jgi:hypothetical protein
MKGVAWLLDPGGQRRIPVVRRAPTHRRVPTRSEWRRGRCRQSGIAQSACGRSPGTARAREQSPRLHKLSTSSPSNAGPSSLPFSTSPTRSGTTEAEPETRPEHRQGHAMTTSIIDECEHAAHQSVDSTSNSSRISAGQADLGLAGRTVPPQDATAGDGCRLTTKPTANNQTTTPPNLLQGHARDDPPEAFTYDADHPQSSSARTTARRGVLQLHRWRLEARRF